MGGMVTVLVPTGKDVLSDCLAQYIAQLNVLVPTGKDVLSDLHSLLYGEGRKVLVPTGKDVLSDIDEFCHENLFGFSPYR